MLSYHRLKSVVSYEMNFYVCVPVITLPVLFSCVIIDTLELADSNQLFPYCIVCTRKVSQCPYGSTKLLDYGRKCCHVNSEKLYYRMCALQAALQQLYFTDQRSPKPLTPPPPPLIEY